MGEYKEKNEIGIAGDRQTREIKTKKDCGEKTKQMLVGLQFTSETQASTETLSLTERWIATNLTEWNINKP